LFLKATGDAAIAEGKDKDDQRSKSIHDTQDALHQQEYVTARIGERVWVPQGDKSIVSIVVIYQGPYIDKLPVSAAEPGAEGRRPLTVTLTNQRAGRGHHLCGEPSYQYSKGISDGSGLPTYGINLNKGMLRGVLEDIGDNDAAKSAIGKATTL
jgi:hypothetical protein